MEGAVSVCCGAALCSAALQLQASFITVAGCHHNLWLLTVSPSHALLVCASPGPSPQGGLPGGGAAGAYPSPAAEAEVNEDRPTVP